MPYMKTGSVREVKNRTWVLAAVAVALILTVAILAGVFSRNPRKFYQAVLSDQDYASYVLMKNVKEGAADYSPFLDRLSENTAYSSTGKVSVELSKDMEALIGSEDIENTALRYLDKLTFESDTQVRALHFSNELKLSDKQQTIFTHRLAFIENSIYSEVPQYGYGWTQVVGSETEVSEEEAARQRIVSAVMSSDNEALRKALTKAAKAGYKEVKGDLQVQIDKDITFDYQDKHATGDRVNVVLSRAEVLHFMSTFFEEVKGTKGLLEVVNEGLDTDDKFASENAWTQFLTDTEKAYTKQIQDTGVTNVSLDLCVDKENDIHAFDALVKRADGDIIVNAMLKDDESRGPAFHLRSGGKNVIKFNVEKSSAQSGKIDFALGEFENTLTYNDFQTADGLLFGTFQFAPAEVSWSEDLGTFGLYLQVLPSGTTEEGTAFHLLARTGFSTLGTATVEADVKDAKYKGMTTKDDLVFHPEYLPEEKRARRIQYWLVDMPEQDSLYNNALSKIIRTVVNDLIEEVSTSAANAKSDDANATLNAGA